MINFEYEFLRLKWRDVQNFFWDALPQMWEYIFYRKICKSGNVNKTCCFCLQKDIENFPVLVVLDFMDIKFNIQQGKAVFIIADVKDLDSGFERYIK